MTERCEHCEYLEQVNDSDRRYYERALRDQAAQFEARTAHIQALNERLMGIIAGDVKLMPPTFIIERPEAQEKP